MRRELLWLSIGLSIGLLSSLLFRGSVVPVNDRDYFPVAYSIIMSANHSVHVIMFEAKYYDKWKDSLSNRLLEALVLKSNSTDVKVFIDSMFNQSSSAYEYLRSHGVDVKYGVPGTTTHSKLVIVDSKYVLLGSTNWGYYSLERNHETNVLVHSREVATAFESYFNSVWEKAGNPKQLGHVAE